MLTTTPFRTKTIRVARLSCTTFAWISAPALNFADTMIPSTRVAVIRLRSVACTWSITERFCAYWLFSRAWTLFSPRPEIVYTLCSKYYWRRNTSLGGLLRPNEHVTKYYLVGLLGRNYLLWPFWTNTNNNNVGMTNGGLGERVFNSPEHLGWNSVRFVLQRLERSVNINRFKIVYRGYVYVLQIPKCLS